jgi:hypothetical protein
MITPNRVGLAVAILYLAGALYVIAGERKQPGFLPTFGTALVTAPVGLPLEWMGFRPNLRSNAVVAALLLANAGLLFLIAAGLVRLITRRGH